MKRIFYFAVVVLLLSSCGPKRFYEDIQSVNPNGWNMDSVLTFQIDITDSSQYYDFYFFVRNNADYAMQNFYVFFTTEFPNGYTAQDTLGFVLCDKYGQWTGKGHGYLKENQFLYRPKIRFAHCGTYKFTAQQAMREENLKGIAEFGMALYHCEE
ncbi:MAG: gliding motility lipoprotein GldH [Bacteroidales bacterium]|nr:gliding motility lipoprotein GldH [Bacteroidales bacterium]